MSTTTIYPSTGHGSHRGRPGSDASENIAALRLAFDGVEEYQRVAEMAQAEAMGLRQRVRDVEAERDEAQRLAVDLRAQLIQHGYADRVRSHEADLLGENRLLRGRVENLLAALDDRDARIASLEGGAARRRRRAP